MDKSKINILVVDDERGLCAGVQEALQREGYAVDAANAENHELRLRLQKRSEPSPLLGVSESVHAIVRSIDEVAQSDVTVLIEGESGTGKELVARSIHLKSRRSDRPFISVNCAALP